MKPLTEKDLEQLSRLMYGNANMLARSEIPTERQKAETLRSVAGTITDWLRLRKEGFYD